MQLTLTQLKGTTLMSRPADPSSCSIASSERSWLQAAPPLPLLLCYIEPRPRPVTHVARPVVHPCSPLPAYARAAPRHAQALTN